jgi:hypothetical protein
MHRALFVLFLLCSVGLTAQETRVAASNPQFDALKTLAGTWEMKMPDGKIGTQSYKIVSDGSAILLDQNPPGEASNMITIFHPDGQKTVATHYCSMGNQPRMVANASSDTKNINFKFKDITNDDGKSGAMRDLTVVLIDKNHHNQIWTWRDPSGKELQETFKFERAAGSAQGQ